MVHFSILIICYYHKNNSISKYWMVHKENSRQQQTGDASCTVEVTLWVISVLINTSIIISKWLQLGNDRVVAEMLKLEEIKYKIIRILLV